MIILHLFYKGTIALQRDLIHQAETNVKHQDSKSDIDANLDKFRPISGDSIKETAFLSPQQIEQIKI